MMRRSASDWIDALTAADVPCSLINSVDEALTHPQAVARGMIVEFDHPSAGKVRVVGPPFQFSQTQPVMNHAPPLLGQHTDELLREILGLRAKEISVLRERGAI